MGDGNEAGLGAPVTVGRILGSAEFQGQIEHRAGYADHNRRSQK